MIARPFWLRLVFLLLSLLCLLNTQHAAPIAFHENDVIAFVGGSDVVTEQKFAYLETLLTLALQNKQLRFRNFGWEGDTVFEQPRDVNFPPLDQHLRSGGASLIFLQFGRLEALDGLEKVDSFISAYTQLLHKLSSVTPRLMLITPPPYGQSVLSHSLTNKNPALEAYCKAIVNLGSAQGVPVLDIFSSISKDSKLLDILTEDGLQLSIQGHDIFAREVASKLNFDRLARTAPPINAHGSFSSPDYEQLRKEIIAKNTLWFNYWRPQNWAFLGGDRTEQPSSRDHINPQIRWFPKEMEQYKGLIEQKEKSIWRIARQVNTTDP